ncbi:MAG: HNH endonuclease [Alphaproteobacteria bacterium]|nr:MAG: HNH endonuclease [Alphaproteobacteria bacterium]
MIEAGASVLRRFVHESPSGVDAENFGYGCINRNIYASSAACSCRSIRSHRASIDHFASKKHQHLYNSRTWKRLRRLRLATDPLCAYCRKQGVTRAATVVDHIKPHRGDWALFADPSNTQSLCKHCHDSIKQSEERLGYSRQIGPDGWPIDPNHPVYNRR